MAIASNVRKREEFLCPQALNFKPLLTELKRTTHLYPIIIGGSSQSPILTG